MFCLRSSNILKTNQVPDAANGKARLTLAAEVHDPRPLGQAGECAFALNDKLPYATLANSKRGA